MKCSDVALLIAMFFKNDRTEGCSVKYLGCDLTLEPLQSSLRVTLAT